MDFLKLILLIVGIFILYYVFIWSGDPLWRGNIPTN